MKFGFCVPVFANPGPAFFRTPAATMLHLAQPLRAPAIAAKMAGTLDALSGGRLIFFYDCGWQEAEVRAYGLDWPAEEERIARMDERLALIEALWTSREPVDFRGRYFSTSAAVCQPGPAQRPRPPIWLGEARSPTWLDAIVRHADGWNSTPASPAHLRTKLDALGAACERAGKDIGRLALSLEIQVLIRPPSVSGSRCNSPTTARCWRGWSSTASW